MVWYSHLFQNFPQFIVIHTVKGFGIVNKAEIDIFLGSKITADGDCSHEIKRHLILERKVMTNLDNRLVPNRKRIISRLYIVTLLI